MNLRRFIGGALHALRQRARYFIGAAVVLAAFAVCLMGFNRFAQQRAAAWAERQPRDTETGVMLGAKGYTAGPEDAATEVILVHGFIGSANNFNELPAHLAEAGFRVAVMRLPGHGTTPLSLRHVSGADLIQAVLDKIRAAKAAGRKVVVVGHSMGGTLGVLASAITAPDGLVLAAPYFKVTHRWYYGLSAEQWTRLTHDLIRWTYKPRGFIQIKREEARPLIVAYRWIPSEVSNALVRLGVRARDPDTLALVTCPVLMLHSRDDSAASPAAAERAFNALGSQDKTLQWLPNSDHHVFWDYDREKVYAAITEFVKRITEPPPQKN